MQHTTCIRSLDVRVAAVAGGSLVRIALIRKKIIDVGPRSAHIAGLPYSCFANPEELEGGQLITFKPFNDDPSDYVAIKGKNGKLFAITTTCAANALDLVKEDDYAKGNEISAKTALSILSENLDADMRTTSKSILETATNKILDVIAPMLKQYKLKVGEHNIVVIGGGGGASGTCPTYSSKTTIFL